MISFEDVLKYEIRASYWWAGWISSSAKPLANTDVTFTGLAAMSLLDWPHQQQGVHDVLAAVAGGARRICLTSPTGGGKTRIAIRLVEHYLAQERKAAIFTNRRLLLEQTASVFTDHWIPFGVRAAGHPKTHQALQIVSTQTVASRGHEILPDADLVIVDEAHLHNNPTMRAVFEHYLGRDAAIVGITATPIDLGGVYSTIVTAGTKTQLRQYTPPALLPCKHYGPDEPDLKAYRAELQNGENLSEKKAANAMGGTSAKLFARVGEWYHKLNPDRKPTLLFAAGVKESAWFAQEFTKRGIAAAHVDGGEVWVDGEFHATNPEIREQVLNASRTGDIKVICNRYVLREGIDCPWLAHGVFATVFGSLKTYLQSGGRLLRAFPGLDSVTLQDHGGNWHRHGSLNQDMIWDLEFTSQNLAGWREDELREKRTPEPFRCPQCSQIHARWYEGLVCKCGFEFTSNKVKTRPVVMRDGELRQLRGDIYYPKKVDCLPNTQSKWNAIYWRARNSGNPSKTNPNKKPRAPMTFLQAEGLFAKENGYWAPRTLFLMPRRLFDWYQQVREVPMARLNLDPDYKPKPQKADTPGLFAGE